jgi:hypothetical protein
MDRNEKVPEPFAHLFGWKEYPKTKCTYCGQETTVMNPGNGCHTCSMGVMVEVLEIKPLN